MKIAKFYLRPASSLHLRRPANDKTDRGSLCKRGNRRIPDLPHREIANQAAQPSALPLRPIARPTACTLVRLGFRKSGQRPSRGGLVQILVTVVTAGRRATS